MATTRKIFKWLCFIISGLVIAILLFGVWFMHLLPAPTLSAEEMKTRRIADLPYLTENTVPYRGKILAVVTSTSLMGTSGKQTGFELTELSRAYYVFTANGFEVDVASPLGGTPPVVIDADDMKEYDYAFLNDTIAQRKVNESIKIQDVDLTAYEAVYFVGGKGAMFDFPENIHIQHLVQDYFESGKVVSAVCHGPAALVNVKLSTGESLLMNRSVSSFTNEEEFFLIPEARDVFPFLLQDKLIQEGAVFNKGFMYLNKVSTDGNLITGQNPWSTWTVAEAVIQQLGYIPKKRIITAEENTIAILEAYETAGYHQAKEFIDDFCKHDPMAIDRELLAVHSIVAGMQFDVVKAVNLIRLLSYSNTYL